MARVYRLMRPRLDEAQRRALLGCVAEEMGRGGVSAVSGATGVSRRVVAQGVKDVGAEPSGRVLAPGGGRKRLEEKDPGLVDALRGLVEPATAGDPTRPLLWTTKSTAVLAGELTGRGHKVSATKVRALLGEMGYSLQASVKSLERGEPHPDRDAQFGYINDQVASHAQDRCPVVSVDTKKKELVGPYKNPGRAWTPKGSPVLVNGHDFPGPDGKAIPYGVYDVLDNTGWVSVGMDLDTSAFAVNTIRSWWQNVGQARYPNAARLLICADAGGSNGSRYRAWKAEIAALAKETGLAITVCHLPPGTSKWNKIEHKMFAFISKNWSARPLVSYEVIVNLINATTTKTGLTIHAELNPGSYPTGVRHTKKQIDALPIKGHDFHPDWNYTAHPA